MNTRPLGVTAVAVLFVCVGVGSLARSGVRFAEDRHVADALMAAASALAAALSGAYMLRGRGWARWLCAFWLAFHVVLSALHSAFGLVFHGALFVATSLVLFRPAATAYFRRHRPDV